MTSKKWDTRFVRLACEVASWSKDPNTKCGAIIIRPNRTVCSTGYNGYPRRILDDDYDDRERKLSRVIHSEMNAILTAPEPIIGYTVYCYPIAPCDRCAVHLIQAQVDRVVYPKGGDLREYHKKSLAYFDEAGVIVDTVEVSDLL